LGLPIDSLRLGQAFVVGKVEKVDFKRDGQFSCGVGGSSGNIGKVAGRPAAGVVEGSSRLPA